MRFFEQNVLKQKNEIICSVRYKKITALEIFKDFDDSKIVKLSAPKRGGYGVVAAFFKKESETFLSPTWSTPSATSS